MNKPRLGATLVAIALLCVRPAAAQIETAAVTGGQVQGVSADGVTSFKGIPFAAPPVRELRWRAPQSVLPWSGIRKADHFAPGCMQPPGAVVLLGEPPAMSEDCLYLNVWTPAKAAGARLPVMVWIYGGSFLAGMTSARSYDGTHLAQHGVVVVSLSYRVGIFGFLADPELSAESPDHASGNQGLLDMIAGLEWVRQNIAQFGGDPSRVTLFGESAGAISVGALAQSPLAKGLFQRAIGESGNAVDDLFQEFVPLSQAEQYGQRLIAKLGAANIAAARALDAQTLLKAQGPALVPGNGGFSPWMVMGGDALPQEGYQLYEARHFDDTPVLIGTNSDEGSLFVPADTTPSQLEAQVRAEFGPAAAGVLAIYPHATEAESSQAAADIVRDSLFAWGAWTWARLQSKYGKNKAYLYYFDQRGTQAPPQGSPHGVAPRFLFAPNTQGSPHGAEIGYVFDNLGALTQNVANTPALAAMIGRYWVNFARSGDPNGPGLPPWPAFDAATRQAMVFDAHPSARPLPNRQKLDVLDRYFKWARQQKRSPVQTQH